MTTQVVTADWRHIEHLAPRLRESDILELRAASGDDAETALWTSLTMTPEDMCWTYLVDGKPAAMFGACPLFDNVGGAWLLATDDFFKYKRSVWRFSVEYVDRMMQRYDSIMNFVDLRNTVSLLWLRRLGFKYRDLAPEYGVEHRPFLLMSKDRYV